jgi:predicted dehydrogenase
MVRWGIAGPGGIAARFVEAMTLVDDGVVSAVASRSLERATAFADANGIRGRYGDYESLATDPGIDIVYVATPNSRHRDDTSMYLAAGKHVLCEKPIALDAEQASDMAELARERKVFLMEAIWSRFLPSYRRMLDLIDDGRIGQVLQVEADFGFRQPFDPVHRLFDRALGGGGLLDLGIYPVQLCHLLLGEPERVAAEGALLPSGVDGNVAAVLAHPEGALGVIKASLVVSLTCTARISGTQGWIDLPAFMHCPESLTLVGSGRRETIGTPWEGDGLRFEIEHVHRCLASGATESPVLELDESIAIARTLDAIRAQVGVTYD